jgi:hypothetical protein
MVANLHLLLWVVAGVVSGAASNTSKTVCTVTLDGELLAFTLSNFYFSGTVRRYYIAAEETEWDYALIGWDNWLGVCKMHTLSKEVVELTIMI